MKLWSRLAAGFLAAAALSGAAAAENGKPIISTTIDFLDMCFYDRIGEKEYYSLEAYESRIKSFAEAGIKRINLRTNVIGVTFYKSAYTLQYGESGAWHYSDRRGSKRLIETLKRYDPLAETIRLGHKYGMEVWCWENTTDEGGGRRYDARTFPADALPDYRRTDGYPLVDPFFRAHPGCWATAKPIDFAAVTATNVMAQRRPIGKIIFEAYRTDRPPIRFSKKDIDLYYSFDNRTYKRYEKDFDFKAERTSEGRNRLILDRLEIAAPYVKIAPKTEYDPSRLFTLAVKGQKSSGSVYNIDGELIPSFWGYFVPPRGAKQPEGFQENTSLDFTGMPSVAVDRGQHQIGFYAGVVVSDNFIRGLVEFCDPVAMKHKVDKFSELARYPFDGFSLTLNCHSDADNPDRFSYHPALRERLYAKTGKDIWRDELPLARIIEERSAGFAEYAEACKRLIGERPLYIYGWKPGDREYFVCYGRTNMGSVIWPYERLIKNGTIDGVIMYEDFSNYFTDKVTGGRKLHLGLYRCVETGRTPKELDAEKLHAAMPNLDEIDYYGAVELGKHLDMIRRFTGAAAK